MEALAHDADNRGPEAARKKDTKQTISKLRAKVNPEHENFMGEAWLQSPDGQDALQRIAAYAPGRATPGRSTLAATLAVRKLNSIKADTGELLQRARGEIPEKRSDQTPAERKRELDQALAQVPALRAERKQMATLERQQAAEQRPHKRKRAVQPGAEAPPAGPKRKRAVAAPTGPSAAPAGAGAPAAERPSARPLQQLLKLKRKCARELLESTPPPHSCGCQRRTWLRSVVRLSSPPVLRRCCGCQRGAGTDVATQRPLRVGHDFAGKNAPGEALDNLGVNSELVFTSEKDKHARKTIEANYSPRQMYNDITERDHSTLRALLDLYLAGWPCIDNSMAGVRRGFRNPVARKLFDCVIATLRAVQPKVAVLENVPGLFSVNGGRDWRAVLRALVGLGCYYVDWRVLNTAKHGVPQNRPRLYIVCIRDDCYRSGAFQWPEPIDDCPSVERFLDQRGPKPTLRTLQPPPQPGAAETWAAQMAKLWRNDQEPLTRPWLWDAGASLKRSNAMCAQCPCLLRSGGGIWISSHGRALSLRERCRLQGSNPDKVKVPVSDHQWRMQLGNSMSINVLERLLSRLLPAAGLTGELPDRWESGAAQKELEETVRKDAQRHHHGSSCG